MIRVIRAFLISYMAVIDIVILVIIGAGAVIGFMKGFVKQLATLLGLIVGLLAAKALYASVAEKVFSKVTDSMTVKSLLLVSLLVGVIEFMDADNTLLSQTKKKESVLYYPMKSFAGIFFPAAKHVTEQYILNE